MQKVFLFHCDLVTPFNEIYLVNIGIGIGLLPDGHQAITWTIRYLSTNMFWGEAHTSDQFDRNSALYQFVNISWNIPLLNNIHSLPSAANEFNNGRIVLI